MNKDTKDNISKVVHSMHDDNIKNEVERISSEDPLISLKNSIYDFFKTRLKRIDDESEFKGVVKSKILERFDELSMGQLLDLYSDLSKVENSSIYALLDIFKPTKEGAVSPLASEVSGPKQINSTQDISPEDAEALNVMTSFLKNAMKDSSDKKEE